MRPTVCLLVMAFLLVALAGPGRAVEGDIVFKRTGDTDKDTPAAVFPHWAHRIRFRCYVCHDAIFQMKAGSSPVTMDAIMDGKFCGA